MKASVGYGPVGLGLKVSAAFFGAIALLTVFLSLAPGAPAELWVVLRLTSAVFALAAIGVVGHQGWAAIPGVAGGALGVLTGVGLMALVPVFIFPEALAVFALGLIVGSSLALWVVLLNRRRQPVRKTLIDELTMLESRGFLIATALVTLCAFVIIPGVGAFVWSLLGCGGQISGALCA